MRMIFSPAKRQQQRQEFKRAHLFLFFRDDMDTLMHRIEWSTLLFFAAMFIQLECLERLRLISWFSQQTINLITLSDDPDVQLTFAIIILMWVSQSSRAYFPSNLFNCYNSNFGCFLSKLSGLLSSIIDSIPVTAMMIKIVIAIGESDSINLPIQPLVWAVAFGPCLGGKSNMFFCSIYVSD